MCSVLIFTAESSIYGIEPIGDIPPPVLDLLHCTWLVISIFIFTAESSISGNLSETSFPPLSSFLHYLEKMGKLGFVKYIIKYHIILYTFFCLYWYILWLIISFFSLCLVSLSRSEIISSHLNFFFRLIQTEQLPESSGHQLPGRRGFVSHEEGE